MRKRIVMPIVLLSGLLSAFIYCPLAWVAPHFIPSGIGANVKFSGTIWNGTVNGLNHIGSAKYSLDAGALIKGGLPLKFQTSSSAMQISGQASRSKIQDLKFSGQLSQLPTTDGRLKELQGKINIHLSSMQFDEICEAASGQADTDFLTRNFGRWQWRGPTLAGPISCDKGDLVAKLSGSEAGQTIHADLRIGINGAYRADISVRTGRPEAGVVLPLYGFDERNGEFNLTEQGKWR